MNFWDGVILERIKSWDKLLFEESLWGNLGENLCLNSLGYKFVSEES